MTAKFDVLFSSEKMDFETPQWLFDLMHRSFAFEVDLAADASNHKLPLWLGPDGWEDDALSVEWNLHWNRGWLNPPYGRSIGDWTEKAHRESLLGFTTVMLVPSRTDTQWWHRWVKDKALPIFLEGRLRFGGAPASAPFPSAILLYLPPINKG